MIRILIVVVVIVTTAIVAAFVFSPFRQRPSQPEGSSSQITPLNLEVVSPSNDQVTNSAIIKIAGSATPKTAILIYADSDQKILQTDSDGLFLTDFQLDEGFNEINILAANLANQTQVTKEVFYTTESLD